ncbi:hypothetical protein G6F49_012512 [Rhizopus delemar]|nr:hypothetical protein G6F49_012512 [Rhizopus delemar]
MPRQTSQDSIHALTEDNVQLRSTLRSLLAENRANATLLIQPYKKGQNIETWLRQFEVAASSVGLNGVSRGIQVLKYLPDEASAWLMRTVDLTHWPTIVEKLASVYGVDPHVQKTICRRKLETLKQGTRRVAEYRMLFEIVVADFPQGHELPDSVLRHIFFSNLRDELKTALLGIVAPEDTWKTLAVAAATRESALFLGNDHLLFEAPPMVAQPPFPMAPPASDLNGPTPMELDAFTQHRPTKKGDRHQHRPVRQKPSSDPMRRWARPGVPICGHCGAEGHLTKRCFKKSTRQAVQVLQEQPNQEASPDYPSSEPSSDDVICSLTYMTKPSVAYRGPRLSCRLLDTTVQALVDTGASISAIDSRLVAQLGLEPDKKASVNFTTADNRNTSSLGTVNVNAVLGELPVYLRCHVIENLSYPIIIGYSDLATLKAIIDTANNTISFPGSNDRYSTEEIPCRAAENLRLPGHHHAHLQVRGTPQALAFVSTPGNLAAEKLLSAAAGIVRFDAAGAATIKMANLSTNINFINKGQQIAFLEYLPSSPTVFEVSTVKHDQDHQEMETPSISSPAPLMDFSTSISSSLPDPEKSQLTNLLSEFGDCFKSKPTTVTPRTQHHIDTGDHKPLSQPPHRASAAENDVICRIYPIKYLLFV